MFTRVRSSPDKHSFHCPTSTRHDVGPGNLMSVAYVKLASLRLSIRCSKIVSFKFPDPRPSLFDNIDRDASLMTIISIHTLFTMRDSMLTVLATLIFALVAQCGQFTNPIRIECSDPHIVTHEGMYYLTHTEGGFISVTRSNTINGLQPHGQERTVWQDSNPSRNRNIWAPEMHLIDGM